MGELVEIPLCDHLCFHAAHGEPGHGSVGLIAKRAKVGIDIWGPTRPQELSSK